MRTYDKNGNLEEHYMYGSGRLGTLDPDATGSTIKPEKMSLEISDHLGSVRAMITGKKKSEAKADISYLSDYYSNGVNSREYVTGEGRPRYLWQGMEWDMEIGSYNFGARFYNPSTGRFNKTDFFEAQLTDYSPYHFAGNNPVYYKEFNGDYFYATSKFAQKMTLKVLKSTFGANNGFSFDQTGKLVHSGSMDMMDSKSKGLLLKAFVDDLVNSNNNHALFVGNDSRIDFCALDFGQPLNGNSSNLLKDNENSIIRYNNTGGKTTGFSLKDVTNSNYGFWHELGHFWGDLRYSGSNRSSKIASDKSAVNFENWVVNNIFNDRTERDGKNHGGIIVGGQIVSRGLLIPQSQFNAFDFLRVTTLVRYSPKTTRPIYSPRYAPVDPPYKKSK